MHTCTRQGVPLADHKRKGPTTCPTYLGIEVDAAAAQLRLPMDKLARLRNLLDSWYDRKMCTRREQKSLLGIINHACKVVSSSHCFRRRMLDLLHRGPTSDASGSWGCGAWHGHSWFQLQWDHQSSALLIMVKELLPIILACAIWGPSWQNHRHGDNQVVVACLCSQTQESHCMNMLRTLAFVEATYDFSLAPDTFQPLRNHLVDDLSQNLLSSFFKKVPHADSQPTPLSLPLLNLLLDPTVDWTSPCWLQLFS